ncbi:MAG: pantoate--beta-alanine ligase [Lutibacter sp.]|uniref:pantoate--beta-alanine ligase n=1 Tax=Lutibacter sp. TaxID=1925666 RepID=UPI0017CBB79E|nr:pantoate--beta-alanine ligase [Lutibacter sp.]MBT8318304.1 pantoate--beta-alanine ligase [Lutibacter sp.]NNJ59161.1 pantoate--beta-alanine ligase [Lutibacter sp.]
MLVFAKIKSVQQKINSLKKGASIGFVPTMGALHKGHLSLIKQAKKENDIVVVSIFVNPTQFNKQEDLINYPKTIDTDLSLLKSVYCDLVFTPTAEEIYSNNIKSQVFDFDGLEHQMEGKFRDGHFNGVGTIVKRLFEIVTPHKAYFGEKDFQQLQIIRKLVQKHHIPVKIIGCDIFRENDGLAMSSRNSRLTEEYRNASPFIYQTLKKAKIKFGTISAHDVVQWVENEFKNQPLLELEYFEIADEATLQSIKNKEPKQKYRAFIAVFAGKIRLIDNISL